MTRCPLCHRTNCPEPDGRVVTVACVLAAALIAVGGFAYGLWIYLTGGHL